MLGIVCSAYLNRYLTKIVRNEKVPIRFVFSTFSVHCQCNKETIVRYYDGNQSTFSSGYKVPVTFAKGSELSNSYNYIGFEQNAFYCVVHGFDKVYNVKLFASYSSIYGTTCSSLSNLFTNGFVKGKDQEGRIWKISFPNGVGPYSYRQERKYNPVTSSINHCAIRNTLSGMQQKIDRNREIVHKQLDAIIYRMDMLKYYISQLGNPTPLVNLKKQIAKNLNYCFNEVDFGSNKLTRATISCLNRQSASIDILEKEVNAYFNQKSTGGEK